VLEPAVRHLGDDRDVALIHTHPKSSRLAIRMARPWSLVHTDDARPYSTPLAQRSASSSSLKRWTVMTGPKISSWIARRPASARHDGRGE
jgi:hypothetical protein